MTFSHTYLFSINGTLWKTVLRDEIDGSFLDRSTRQIVYSVSIFSKSCQSLNGTLEWFVELEKIFVLLGKEKILQRVESVLRQSEAKGSRSNA